MFYCLVLIFVYLEESDGIARDNVYTCRSKVVSTNCLVVNKGPIYASRGNIVMLECSYIGQNETSIAWYDPQGQRLKFQRLNNNSTTIQVALKLFSWQQQGNYTCKASGNTGDEFLLEKQIRVIFGDVPDPPVNLTWRSFNFNIGVYWKSSAYRESRFNTTYTALAKYYCAGEKDEFSTVCSGLIHKPNQAYFCHVDSQFGSHFACPTQVNVTVSNVFGSATKFVIFNALERTTPLPPQNVTVIPSNERQLTVRWWPPALPDASGFTPSYRLVYKEIGTKIAKAIECGMSLSFVITGLRTYTWYQVSVQVQLDPIGSPSWSSLSVPVLVHTLEEEPSTCPIITSWSSIQTGQPHRRDVTIEWSLPSNKTWNGKITKILISYSEENSQSKTLKIATNTSYQKATLPDLRMTHYALQIQICNSAGCCGNSNITWISPGTLFSENSSSRKSSTLVVVTLVIMTVLLLFAASFITHRLIKKRKCCWKYRTGSVTEFDEEILVESQEL